jgi:hypothetical protein
MSAALHDRAEIVACEDLITFLNASFSATSQASFYGTAESSGLALDFLHTYIAHHHRRLYARCLASGINHHAQARIVATLLAMGAPADLAQRAEEGKLLMATLRALPPQRAYKALASLRAARVNNRRTRAIIRDLLLGNPRLELHAIKYRRLLKELIRHAHISAEEIDPELHRILFDELRTTPAFARPLWETYRRAYYSKAALYDLPYSIAEGLAQRHQISRRVFLRDIAPRMTSNERLRTQQAARSADAPAPAIDLARVPLTRLALFILGLSFDDRHARWSELEAALHASAAHTARRIGLQLGSVALVLDNSWSSRSGVGTYDRPLAVALATEHLVRAVARAAEGRCTVHWTMPQATGPACTARGQTNLARPLLDALEQAPELVIIVSDGCENDPPCGAHEVTRLWRAHLDPGRATRIIHLNPTFDADQLGARPISPLIPTVGLRDAEDLPRALAFARFAANDITLAELEEHLERCVHDLIDAPVAPDPEP